LIDLSGFGSEHGEAAGSRSEHGELLGALSFV